MSDCRLTESERAAFRERADRRPKWNRDTADLGEFLGKNAAWRAFFDGDTYLGERSSRTGPDSVGATQRCNCEVCCGNLKAGT